jgi:hypothetical protein
MLTIAESTQILKSHGITVFNRYGKRYSLRREHPGYGTPESRSPLAEWFSVTDCSLGDVRAMAHAYEALSWPDTRRYAEIARIGLKAAWADYTARRIDAERLGRAANDWTLPDDPDEAVAQIQARGSERAHWHTHRVWQEITRSRLSAIAGEATPC